MYSEEDLERIVQYYREPVKLREFKEVSDVKLFPNDILMSYLISDESLNRQQLAEILNDLKALEEWLGLYSSTSLSDSELPPLADGMDYSVDPPYNISTSIKNRTEKYCLGDDNEFLVADKSRKVFVYPSGEEVEYFALTDEYSANISIFDAGYAPDEIYLRENFVTMMMTWTDVQKHNPEFAQYREQMGDFEDFIRGITLAHEISEIEILKSGKIPEARLQTREGQLELELTAEHNEKQYLERHGIDLKHFELYHLLRATCDERGRNVSQIIVNQNFQPLA
mgnify:CR=1 FL=1|jgi:hypothetical protein|tara:strand:- start:444 stop:1289 length:846 start_codon:yes stop_codon:yes gene_type:complete